MKVKYFHDTATALIEFSAHAVAETKEINENIYIDLDAGRNLVAIGRMKNVEGEPFDEITTKFYSETGGDVFNGNDGMGGLKFSSWEGGTRIPYVVRYPGRITPNCVSDYMLTNYDLMSTFTDLIGVELPQGKKMACRSYQLCLNSPTVNNTASGLFMPPDWVQLW